MARHDTDWAPDTVPGPKMPPETREQLVQDNRARREQEPAAAPQETDSESGASAQAPMGRIEPLRGTVPAPETGGEARKRPVGRDPADVRAGPGDAGSQRTPKRRTWPDPRRSDSWGRALGSIVVIVLIGAVAGLLL
jgi:hypothetical protein